MDRGYTFGDFICAGVYISLALKMTLCPYFCHFPQMVQTSTSSEDKQFGEEMKSQKGEATGWRLHCNSGRGRVWRGGGWQSGSEALGLRSQDSLAWPPSVTPLPVPLTKRWYKFEAFYYYAGLSWWLSF